MFGVDFLFASILCSVDVIDILSILEPFESVPEDTSSQLDPLTILSSVFEVNESKTDGLQVSGDLSFFMFWVMNFDFEFPSTR